MSLVTTRPFSLRIHDFLPLLCQLEKEGEEPQSDILAGCSSQTASEFGTATSAATAAETTTEAKLAGTYTPGTYTAVASGYGGDVTITVTVDEKAITEVTVEGPDGTEGVGSKAVEELPKAIKPA